MLKHEFEIIAGYSVSEDDYYDIIEPMYNATNLDKDDFIKCLDRKRFEIIVEKSQERIELEEQINTEIRNLKEAINGAKLRLDGCKKMLEGEDDEKYIKRYKAAIKQLREEIKLYKIKIATLNWVLE